VLKRLSAGLKLKPSERPKRLRKPSVEGRKRRENVKQKKLSAGLRLKPNEEQKRTMS
jgi:hypothetical protein